MLKDKHTDYEISKLQKQIDRKKTTTVINNITPSVKEGESTILNRPVASDMKVSDGQSLVFNNTTKQWEPGVTSNMRGVAVFVSATEPTDKQLHDIWIQI